MFEPGAWKVARARERRGLGARPDVVPCACRSRKKGNARQVPGPGESSATRPGSRRPPVARHFAPGARAAHAPGRTFRPARLRALAQAGGELYAVRPAPRASRAPAAAEI